MTGGELWDRAAIVHDVDGAAVEVVESGLGGIDAEVLVDGGEEIMRAARALDDVFTAFVRGPDDAAGLDATTGPEIGKARGQWSRPGCKVPAGPLASPAPVLRSKVMRGVRPNSPVTTTSTFLSRPRA